MRGCNHSATPTCLRASAWAVSKCLVKAGHVPGDPYVLKGEWSTKRGTRRPSSAKLCFAGSCGLEYHLREVPKTYREQGQQQSSQRPLTDWSKSFISLAYDFESHRQPANKIIDRAFFALFLGIALFLAYLVLLGLLLRSKISSRTRRQSAKGWSRRSGWWRRPRWQLVRWTGRTRWAWRTTRPRPTSALQQRGLGSLTHISDLWMAARFLDRSRRRRLAWTYYSSEGRVRPVSGPARAVHATVYVGLGAARPSTLTLSEARQTCFASG